MGTTTQPLGIDFPKQIVTMITDAIDKVTKEIYQTLWDILITLIKEHWGFFLVVLFLILLVAFVRYMITGRWAILGSIIYNYLYFGILFIVGLIFGPDIFASDYIKILLTIVYIACYTFVGKIFRR